LEVAGWEIAVIDVGMVPIDAADMGPEGAFTPPLRPPVNALALRGHGLTVLVDAGAGPLVGLWPGATERLAEALEEGGIEPDLLVATHLDFDHAGGFVDGTWPDGLAPRFPGRRVLAPADAVADARARAGEDDPAPRVVAALDAAGLLEEYGDGDEPAPGLRLRSAPGHRAGHSILEIGDSFVHAADAFHDPLHVEHPEWDTAFDSDPELGLATRRALCAELADRHAVVVVSHIASPGRIERAGEGFRWVDAEK
jgi:glyoxylase-like metal-dependent hydrolase (beta-lactamase superfamily II)